MPDALEKLAAKAKEAQADHKSGLVLPPAAPEPAKAPVDAKPDESPPAKDPAPGKEADKKAEPAKAAKPEEGKAKDPEPEVAPEDPLKDVKFPALDKLASHFYDNEAGTFWVGLNLRGNVMALPHVLDAAKLPLLDAFIDFQNREARKRSLIARVSGAKDAAFETVKESLTQMMDRLKNLGGAGSGKKKSLLAR